MIYKAKVGYKIKLEDTDEYHSLTERFKTKESAKKWLDKMVAKSLVTFAKYDPAISEHDINQEIVKEKGEL